MNTLLAWMRLFRLPNVFTALADIMLGYMLTHGEAGSIAVFAALMAASALLYTAGMALNDVFDIEQDRQERPFRPLPSGEIAWTTARAWGAILLAAGVGCGALAGFLAGTWRSGVVAAAVATMVVLYNAGLKRTPLGPLAMGACRCGNILLGTSAGEIAWPPMHYAVAAGLGVYITGVTWFARTEATTSRRLHLAGATLIMIGGLALLGWSPWAPDAARLEVARPGFALQAPERWMTMWVVLGALIVWRCWRAVFEPSPRTVQIAVKHCILSIIILDAAVCLAAHGPQGALAIALLLAPTMLLSQWVYST